MKSWIKSKVTSFLGIDSLEQKLLEENKQLKFKLENLESLNQKIIEENNSIMKQFNISADINHYENHSWAVISIQGKPEYVKFVNLSNQDMRSVHSFLKQFERTNRTIDSPLKFLKF
ncbi:hypothetical protein MOF24_17385 [Bacillus inaquosorum]|uniref:hypothetical protein n=1 Tax=Bacillus inaquosorum TaxID=483913 RepID=UPI00227F74E6|nr:hypothetical protein [Bacillus inaquosorum]MCY9273458.1 hypothetical protein [Bacillus inaquosorum]